MNKVVKEKKKLRLVGHKSLTKQDYLFCKKYPRLFCYCTSEGISRRIVDKAYKKIARLGYDKDTFENMFKIVGALENKKYNSARGSYGEFYRRLFRKLNICAGGSKHETI